MAESAVEHLLVGGGMASAHAAAELRRRGVDGRIMIVGREPDPPYERPPLSKEYLSGAGTREQAFVHDPDWYEENSVELLTRTNVMSLDPGQGTADLQGGEQVGFATALLATGAMVNILRPEGAGIEGVHYLRAFGNSDAIREEAAAAERVILIGGSYIACEVAATLRAGGTECTMVMLEDVALSGTFGREAGAYFDDLLRQKGVEVHRGESLEAFEGSGRVEAVVTGSGTRIEGDMVVVGAGVKPDTMLAKRAGLEIDDGISCDRYLRSSAPNVFAAGDCCSYDSPLHGRRVRVEHWDVALNQGRVAARNMLGDEVPYEVVPYFFSDLADWASIEYVGAAREWDEVVFRGEFADGRFSAWYLQGGRLVATLAVDQSEDLAHARELIASGGSPAGLAEVIADPATPLSQLTA